MKDAEPAASNTPTLSISALEKDWDTVARETQSPRFSLKNKLKSAQDVPISSHPSDYRLRYPVS